MRKFILFVFTLTLGLSNNQSLFEIKEITNDKIVISFTLKEYQLKNNNGYTEIVAPHLLGTKSLIGEPLLPSISSFVQLDKYTSYDIDYNIISQKEYLNKEINPLQNFDKTKNENFIKNEFIYNSNSQYPEKNLYSSDRLMMRGNEFVNIELTPFSYHSNDKKLIVMEEIEITIESNGEINQPLSRNFPNSKVFERLINSMVINPTDNTNSRNEDYQKPHVLYICGGSSATNSYFNQLVDWRKKQGYQVTIATTSSNDNDGLNGNSTTNVKNYLEDSMDWDNPPEFVTLVGDVDGSFAISTFTEYDSGYQGRGDHPYSQLDGNDLWPEVAIGRISVRSTSELAVVVNKIIGYEQSLDMDGNWHEKAGIVGDPSTSGISCAITAENIAERMIDSGMEDVRLKISGGSYDTWMRNQLSEGVSYLNYRGYYGVSGFGNSDVDAASSPGYRIPFATIITCGTGSIEETECLSEKFLRAGSTVSPKGAVACIGTATIGTHTMFNNAVNIGIYEGIFTQKLQTAGEALVAGKANLYENYPSNPNNWVTIFTHWNNLMGDASTTLWTGEPIIMEVEHPSTINQGQTFININITTNDQNPSNNSSENVLVTLYDGRSSNEFYTQGYTDENGEVTLTFDPNDIVESDNLAITVTKFGNKPYMDTINITNQHTPYIEQDQVDLDLNGILLIGEQVEFSPTITYNGTDNFSNVSGVLTSDGNVNIIENTVNYDTIENGESEPNGVFVFELTELQEYNSTVNFFISLTDDSGNEFVTSFSVLVDTFNIEILSAEITNDDDGDGRLDPGEDSNLYLVVENNGSAWSPNLICTITTESADLSITANEQVNLVEIDPGNTINTTAFTSLSLENTAFNGEVKLLDINCQSDLGFELISQVGVDVGQTSVSDPTGPDEYGYYIYDYADNNYTLVPTYDWIDIEDIGNSLDDVNDDDGNNQDAVETISLPFNFGFYGEVYDEISVSSNGWISFGETDLESFRNDHLPGPGGPSPMLAVFWDDLTADSGGEVFSYYDSVQNIFIIQWDNVKTYEDNSNESFQAILFDPQYYLTPTGDGEILLQYEDFNNTSNGSYGGGTPLHGGYCSIGIEDHTGLMGIEYTFNNTWARTGSPLYDGTALFISTRKTGTVFNTAQSELLLSNNELNFEIEGEETQSQNITLSNVGEEESILSYNISSSPFSDFQDKDNYGNHWTDSDNGGNSYDWVEVDTESADIITFETNDQGQSVNLGFDFKFYGEAYNELIINPNGWIGFGEDNTQWTNENLPNNEGPLNAIFGFWDDLNPINNNPTCSNESEGYVYHQSFTNKEVIWFNEVVRCGSNEDYAALLDFQIVLHKDQRIDINYQNMDGYLNSGTVGIQNDIGSDAIEIIYNDPYVHDQLTLSFKPLADWINPIYDEQQLNYLEQVSYEIIINGEYIENDTETSYLIINSNSTEPQVIIPISVEQIEEPGLTGDINGDQVVNILDVVALVNIVISGSEYDENADVNNDGTVNILDVVQLVNIVLNS